MSYECIIAKLKNVRSFPDPKVTNIQLAECCGCNIIVSKDNYENQLGLFFPEGGCLNKDFALINKLYRKHPDTGELLGGYFEENLRIKSIKLMNEQSDGFWCPIEYLQNYVGNFDVKEGQTFSSYNGKEVCSKYFTPQTNGIRERNQQIKKARIPSTFKEHFDTEAFIKANIPIGAKLIITEKMEGCVDGSTLIDTLEYGILRIDKIVKEKLFVHIKSFDFETNEIVYSMIEEHFFKPNDLDWYEIELENGISLIITGNNPVWMPKYNCYRRTEELKDGDILLID